MAEIHNEQRVIGVNILSAVDYFAQAAAGKITGASYVSGFGNNPDIDSGTVPEDIWAGGGAYPWLAAATALEIVSASTNDAAAGTGMRTVIIQGLDANYAEVTQTLTLNGLTPVPIPLPLLRVNVVQIATAGSVGTNVGAVTVRDAGGGTTRSVVPAGFGRKRSSGYTVPAGKTLLLGYITMSINRPTTARDATVSLMIRNAAGAYSLVNEVSVDGNPVHRNLTPPGPIPEKTDIIFRCTYVSQDNTDLTVSWAGILRDA